MQQNMKNKESKNETFIKSQCARMVLAKITD